jgi:hypothetical protein
MYDRVSVTRSTGETLDLDTGLYVANTPEIIYAGKARVTTTNTLPTDAGERLRMKSQHFLTIPAGIVTEIHNRDLVTVVQSINSRLQGDSFYIMGETTGTTALSRKFTIQNIQE